MWTSSHLHGPRRSHDQSHNSRSSSPDDGTESPRRRTSSDATPRQTPATTRFLNDQESFKRLGFFADKLTSSLSGTAKETGNTLKNTLHPSQLLHPHIHSRGDSGSASPNPSLSTMTSNPPMPSKSHTSPSKVLLVPFFLIIIIDAVFFQASYGRTYDPKVVSREMHRLGNQPPLSSAPSAASLTNTPSVGLSQTGASSALTTGEPWNNLHVHVLPLFNGEPLRIPMHVIQSYISHAYIRPDRVQLIEKI